MIRTKQGDPVEILEKDLAVDEIGVVRVRFPLDIRQGTTILPILMLVGDDGAGEIRAALERVPAKDLIGRGNPLIIQALELLAKGLDPSGVDE